MACILDDGDELLVPEPFYANYNTFTFMSGGVIHPIPTSADNGYRFADRKLIESQINERTRAILVTNPGNPTGTVLTHEEMEMLVDVARQHDLFLIGDEAYREFVYAGEPLQSSVSSSMQRRTSSSSTRCPSASLPAAPASAASSPATGSSWPTL